MEINEIDTPKDWPDHVREFLTIEQLLRCEICFNFFTNCMMTSCSHNFCSLCIRKHLSYKSSCPICFKETIEPALKSNRLIDEVVSAFFNARSKLITMLKEPVLGQDVKQPFYKNTLNTKRKEAIGHDIGFVSPSVLEECSTKAKPRAESKTKCEARSNRLPMPKRPYLPKLVYHFLKDKDIRDCLKQAGLKANGKRRDMVSRHKQFVILYNAECDSENPRPDSALVKEIEDEETMMQTLSNKSKKSFTTNRHSNPDAIEKERKSYVQSHSNEYQKLIAEIKNQHIVELACEPEVTILPSPSTSSLGKQSVCIDLASDSSDSESAASCYYPFKDVHSDTSNTTEELPDERLDLDETLLLGDCKSPFQSTRASCPNTLKGILAMPESSLVLPVTELKSESGPSNAGQKLPNQKANVEGMDVSDDDSINFSRTLVDLLEEAQSEQPESIEEMRRESVTDTSPSTRPRQNQPEKMRKRKTASASIPSSKLTGNVNSARRMSLRKRNSPPQF